MPDTGWRVNKWQLLLLLLPGGDLWVLRIPLPALEPWLALPWWWCWLCLQLGAEFWVGLLLGDWLFKLWTPGWKPELWVCSSGPEGPWTSCRVKDSVSVKDVLAASSGRAPKRGNGNPLQYSCLKNPMDRGSWQAIVHGVTESNRT